MKWNKTIGVIVFMVASLVPCSGHHIAVIVNKANNTDTVTSAHLAQFFRAETKKWADGGSVVLVIDRSSTSQMATLQKLNHMTAAELKAFLAAHAADIKQLNSDADVLEFVQSNPGAIGLIEVHSLDSRVKIVKVDGKLPLEEGYLSH